MINIKPVSGFKDQMVILDQTQLPVKEVYLTLTQLEEVEDAIKRLAVRGAPAIGIAAAYGIIVHVHKANTVDELKKLFEEAYIRLGKTRPTAVNLFWALNRMKKYFETQLEETQDLKILQKNLYREAENIEREDFDMCRKIGEYGTLLMEGSKKIKAMTICNAGGLATAGYGTALACFYMAQEKKIDIEVFALETRPLLQGARLTAYELLKAGIKTTLLTDNMAGFLMQKEKIDLIIAGADRIASNGDAANKIGTYQLAVLAKYHGIPFYIAAPVSTFDLSLKSGDQIPIEFRGKEEVTHFGNLQTAPENVEVFSPAFDVTPSQLIQGIITNQGIFYPPYDFSKLKVN